MDRRGTRLIATVASWRPSSILRSLDLALIDPPSLCCTDDEMCPACRADSDLSVYSIN